MTSAPLITETTGGYCVSWADSQIDAHVRRVRVTSDGGVKGELEIIHHNKRGDVCLLPASQFNFSSETTRRNFAKQLKEKISLSVEWKEIFDFLAVRIQELARAGDGYVEVLLEDDVPPPERLLGSIIYKGVQNLIFGDKGVAKSTLAYLFAICVGLPWSDNPFGFEVPALPVATLVLDWETDESIFRYYLSRLKRGMALPQCPIYYRRCTLPLRDDIETIERQMAAVNAKLLIIDSLGAAAGGEHGELKGSEAALLFNAALRKLKTTALIVGQTAKGESEQGKRKTVYGSTYFTYYARNIFELCRGEDDYSDTLHLAMFHRESNLGKRLSPMGFCLQFNDSTGAIIVEREPVSVSEFSQKLNTQARILEALKSGAVEIKELAASLEVPQNNCRVAISRLARQGKVVKVGKAWGLAAL